MFHRITDIKALPGMHLKARFDDGETRLYDVAPLQTVFPIFQTLSTCPGLFENVKLDAGGYGVVWNEDVDLAAEEIWENGQPGE